MIEFSLMVSSIRILYHKSTPLIWASMNGHLEIVRYMYEHLNPSNYRVAYRYIPEHTEVELAMYCAIANNHLDVVKYLHGSDRSVETDRSVENQPTILTKYSVNLRANNDYPIRTAAYCGYVDMFRYIYENGADVTVEDTRNYVEVQHEIIDPLNRQCVPILLKRLSICTVKGPI